jgi:DNA-binding transcriptional LysR family regulator
MLEGIAALAGLDRAGTVSEAAVSLRLTQSAVSKRIKALENELGYPLVEADGRRLRLTPRARTFLSKAGPLAARLEGLKRIRESAAAREFSIGVSDSIASSWGPRVLKRALAGAGEIALAIHVHRSLLILERLRLGRYELGLVTGRPHGAGLVWSRLAEEPMVLVGAESRDPREPRKILTIETASATWREIGGKVLGHDRLRGRDFVFLESFAAAAQMAKEGFGQALVPLGTAAALGFRASETAVLAPRVSRQVHLVSRKSIHGLGAVRALKSALIAAAGAIRAAPAA